MFTQAEQSEADELDWNAHEIWSAGRPPCACEDAVINHDVTIDDEANVRT